MVKIATVKTIPEKNGHHNPRNLRVSLSNSNLYKNHPNENASPLQSGEMLEHAI